MKLLNNIWRLLFPREVSHYEELDKYWRELYYIAWQKLWAQVKYDVKTNLFFCEVIRWDTYQRKEISKECVESFMDKG